MRQMEVPAATMPRVKRFLAEFSAAPNDADIEIRVGSMEGLPSILVSISGHGDHALLAREARVVADIMEETMHKFSAFPEAATLPNIIMGLRAGCDQAERTPVLTQPQTGSET